MFELNIAGVNDRYGQGEAKTFRDLTYRYCHLTSLSNSRENGAFRFPSSLACPPDSWQCLAQILIQGLAADTHLAGDRRLFLPRIDTGFKIGDLHGR
jgi:hypothetical protein